MDNLLVHSFAPNDELDKSIEKANALSAAMAPHKVSLNKEVRKSLRVVGTSRMGLLTIIDKVATQYDEKLAKNEKASDLTQRIAYLHKLRKYKLAIQNLLEALDDTDKALGKDIMSYVDKFGGSLSNVRKHDGDLDEAMKELDDYNARFGKIMEQEDNENKDGEGKNSDTPQ